MTLQRVAVPGVETAGPDTAVDVLADRMAERDVGSIVITDGRVPIGIVTDRDLVVSVVREGADPGRRPRGTS